MNDELVERLRDADRNSVQRMNGSRIFDEAADRIEALTARAEARESERAAMTEVNACKDALAQAGGTFERDDHD